MIGFLDASNRNNEDAFSQRGMTVFLSESRERFFKGRHVVWKCYALLKVLLMPVSPWIVVGHIS